MPRKTAPSALVLVEGRDDERFFEALWDHLRLGRVQVRRSRGRSELITDVCELGKAPELRRGVEHVGIVIDANGDPTGSWELVCNALREANLPVPDRTLFPSAGAPRPGRPRITAMILPGPEEPGMLEDVCLRGVADRLAMECVDAYFDCLRSEARVRLPALLGKRRMQVYLASCRQCHGHIGEAARNLGESPAWDWDHAAFDGVKDFLRTVAGVHDPNDARQQ